MSSITSSSATVSWTPYGGAAYTILYYQIQGASSWSTVNVGGSSYNLTGLSPCQNYDVKLRSFCFPLDYSGYTSTASFCSASSNPSVSISVEMVDNGCRATMDATPGFVSYLWSVSGSDTTMFIDNDTTGVAVDFPGTYYVLATDLNGCTATNSVVITSGMFTGGCITDAHNELMSDSLEAHIVQVTSDMDLLAKGLAGLVNHSGIKALVKSLALDDPY